MTIALLAFFGGILTIVSPCVLPVLPFVFARAEQPFLKSGLPLLLGMALTFAGIATLAAVGGAWAIHVNQYGRIAALVLLAAFALTLLSRHLADWMARPFVALGDRLSQSTSSGGIVHSALLGVATGLLWAPCAGPILGLILTGAALSGPNTQTTLLLFAYAAGAATSLAVVMFAGGRVFTALKKSLGAGEWVRRGLGAAVLVAVAAIALGWDSGVLTRLSLASTNRFEQSLIGAIDPDVESSGDSMSMSMSGSMTMTADSAMTMSKPGTSRVLSEGELPPLSGASTWLNSPPLTPAALRGKVVLIDFWTYSCINCLRSLPYVKSWYKKYKNHGLVVIGVHAPEFAFEKSIDNVRRAVGDLGIAYPVALDNDYAIWQSFNNKYWPAHYFVDAQGRIRGHHYGEGNYDESEQTIRQLLVEAGFKDLPSEATAKPSANGAQAAANEADVKSPETYVGYERAENFSSPTGFAPDQAKHYVVPAKFSLNQWALDGQWIVSKDHAALVVAPGKITFRFHARDLHLVLGPGVNGKPVRFRVQLDGAVPGSDHGMDTDERGNGVVKTQRLYQLIRQSREVREHVFTIEFLDNGVQAYAFTFG